MKTMKKATKTTYKDLTSPGVGAGLAESFGENEYTAEALLQLVTDHVASALDRGESPLEPPVAGKFSLDAVIAELFADQDRRTIVRAGGLLALKNGRIVRVKIKPKAAESS